jgi:hypothetical protein
MLWDNFVVTVRWIFTAVLFIAAIPVVVYAAAWLVLGQSALTRIGGVVFLILGFLMWPFAFWLALGRPKDWFQPGRNTDFDPRR